MFMLGNFKPVHYETLVLKFLDLVHEFSDRFFIIIPPTKSPRYPEVCVKC